MMVNRGANIFNHLETLRSGARKEEEGGRSGSHRNLKRLLSHDLPTTPFLPLWLLLFRENLEVRLQCCHNVRFWGGPVHCRCQAVIIQDHCAMRHGRTCNAQEVFTATKCVSLLFQHISALMQRMTPKDSQGLKKGLAGNVMATSGA